MKTNLKRAAIYLIGMFTMAMANAISKMTPLGISPNSSLPNEISIITGVDLGTVTAVVFSFFVIIQWILLGKNFRKINFIQIPLSILYGNFINLALAITSSVLPPCDTYFMQIVYTLVSAAVLGFGVEVYLAPKLMPLPAEGMAQVIAQKTGLSFPTVKNICDITIVTISIILSLIYFGKLFGIREGTIIHAILVGRCVKLADRLFGERLKKFVSDGSGH